MFKIFRIATLVLVMCLAAKVLATESATDYFDLRAGSGLVIVSTDPTYNGVPATQMFSGGITLYVDNALEMYSTSFTITNYVKVQRVGLLGYGSYSGLNFIRGTRGIILKAKPQNPALIDPSLIDPEGYVTILNKPVYLPDDTDIPAGEARYVDVGGGIDFGLDHCWDVNVPLQIMAREFKVSYLADDSGWFSPRIDELDGLAGPVCGDGQHPYPTGDFNQDCYVDFKDLAVFVGYWLLCNDPESPCNYVVQ
jgi:hypothetical protein